VLLGATTFAAYWPIWQCGFVNFDDQEYVTQNPHLAQGLNAKSIAWAFSASYAGNWHPLTWLSHALDVQLFALQPLGHHLTSLLLHLVNSLLLFGVLNLLTGAFWRSGLAAALFAVHPIHVESVAWISERKDVLSTLFFLLTIWAYTAYAGKTGKEVKYSGNRKFSVEETMRELASSPLPSPPREEKGISPLSTLPASICYLLALVFFALGLMSKPMLVTLPAVLLLLDYWPLGRLSLTPGRTDSTLKSMVWNGFGKLLLEKLPFLSLSAASCFITFNVQNAAGATASLEVLPLEFRIGNALVSYVRYIAKTVFPAHLAVFYPPPKEWPLEWQLGAILVLSGITAAVLWSMNRSPYLVTGWLWYLGMLVPVIGIIQVGQQAMADRYSYIPLIGLFIMISWGGADLVVRWPIMKGPAVASAVVALLLCCGLTWNQVGFWRSSTRLWERALAVTTGNVVAHNNLGVVLLDAGDLARADEHFAEAARIKPNTSEALVNLGFREAQKGDVAQAKELFERVIRVQPTAQAHYDLGLLLSQQNDLEQAESHYQAALKMRPEFAEAWFNLGVLRARQGRTAEAARCYEQALNIRPNHVDSHLNLGAELAGLKNWDAAIPHFRTAIQLNPTNADAHFDLAEALQATSNNAGAAIEFARVCELRPRDSDARMNLALIELSQGRATEALKQLQEIVKIGPDARAQYYLALTLDGLGRPADALAHYKEALRLEPANPIYLNDLAWLLATSSDDSVRNGSEAVRLIEQAFKLSGGKEARYWGTLDAAYAEVGRFSEAEATASRTKEMAQAAGQDDIARAAEIRLQLYREHKPYRFNPNASSAR
jgi:tetratricopeptide (TPR) repeat protein